MPASPIERPQGRNFRRTRRNVIAMAGILTSTVVGGTTIAHAMGGWFRRGGGGGGHGCLLCGTKILTDAGETAVENLGVGDMVSTVSGESQAIKQIISWTAERAPNQDWTDEVAPIKICRSALAPNVPHRDLYLSPGHSLFLDGVLICAKGLVNNRTIIRCSKGREDTLSYYHLKLEDHQIILAEGAPVESYPDPMSRFGPDWFAGRKSELTSRLRSAISPWVDRRKVADRVRDRLDERGDCDLAA